MPSGLIIPEEGRNRPGFWNGELGYRHAAVAIAGLLTAGWLIEWVRDGSVFRAPVWPINALFLLTFILWIVALSRIENRITSWLGGVPFALMSMVAVGVLGAIGGIVPQTADAPAWTRALGWHQIFPSPAFIAALLALLTNLGLATLRRVRGLGWRGWLSSISHVGLWIAIAGAMFGSGDLIRARMMLVEGNAEARIIDGQGRQGYLPFGLYLQRFYVEQYPGEENQPGPARKYAAEVTVLHRSGLVEDKVIIVNQPLRRAGWTLYLTNYELSPGGQSNRCVIEAVRDPWLPVVYVGIFLLIGGAAAMLFVSPFPAPNPEEGR